MTFDGPRLRRDLVSTISLEDGIKCVDVYDPTRGSSFRLFDYEYSVALAFDGRPLAKVIPWVRLSTGLELTAEQLRAFAERLDQLGFLASDQARTPGLAPEERPALVTRTVAEAPPTPVPIVAQPLSVEVPGLVPSQPVGVEAPVPVPAQPAPAGDEAPAPPAAESRLATVEPEAEAAASETPSPSGLPAAEPPAAAFTPPPDALPAAEPPAAVLTPSSEALPAAEPPAAVLTPSSDVLPAAEPPAAVLTPSSEALPAAEPPAAVLTPSSEALPAAEPPAAVLIAASPPDGPSQAQPPLLAVDGSPAPADSSLPPASAATQEPSPVPLDTRPPAALDKAPPRTLPRAGTPPPHPNLPPQGRKSAAEVGDGTSRLRTAQVGAGVLTPEPRRVLTPPPLLTPAPVVTPARLRPATARGSSWILYALFGTLAALAVGLLAVPLALKPHPPAAVRVRVVVAKPTAILRWFDGAAPLEALPGQTLSFPVGGKVIRLASPGISVRPGDLVAATDLARWALADLAQQQERLAYFEQLSRGVRDTGDEKRVGAARAKVEFRAGLVERMRVAVSRVAVVAEAPGQVEATLATLGQTVRPGAPAVRLRSAGWRANFELPRTLAANLRRQGFCSAEIDGRPVACSLAPSGGDETHVVIDLTPETATASGHPVHLAHARFADAFLLPASALSRVGDSDRVLLVAPTGRAEVRSVTVADRGAADAVITQGLDAGDAVIIESSEPVAAGARVRTTEHE